MKKILFHSLNQNLNKQNEAKQCILPVCNNEKDWWTWWHYKTCNKQHKNAGIISTV